jgi:hypothetical protein
MLTEEETLELVIKLEECVNELDSLITKQIEDVIRWF